MDENMDQLKCACVSTYAYMINDSEHGKYYVTKSEHVSILIVLTIDRKKCLYNFNETVIEEFTTCAVVMSVEICYRDQNHDLCQAVTQLFWL